jgi:DNA repair exonuclease SbcCD ATPase subunit
MLKKLGIASAALLVGLLVVTQTRVGQKLYGLGELAVNKLFTCADKSIPLDVEIDRIASEVDKLDKDIVRSFDTLAVELRDVEKLKKDVEDLRTNLSGRLTALDRMNRDLKKGDTEIVYQGQTYPASRIQEKFAQDWRSYKVSEEHLKVKEKLLAQKQTHVDAIRTKINNMRDVKEQLKTELARLKTELEAVRLAQTQAPVQIDDSRLAHIRGSINEVKDRIRELQIKVELQGQVANDPIPVEAQIEADKAVEEFNARFGANGEKVAGGK